MYKKRLKELNLSNLSVVGVAALKHQQRQKILPTPKRQTLKWILLCHASDAYL